MPAPSGWLLLLTLLWYSVAMAQPPAAPSPATQQAQPKQVVAEVNGEPIFAPEIARALAGTLRDRPLDAETRKSLEARILEQLIDRQLILQYLDQKKLGASQQDLDQAMQRVEKQLQQQQLTLEQYFQRSGLDAEQLRRTLAWELGWRRYLERYLTDDNLQRYFQQHRRHFDGTRLRVAHILLKVEPPDDRQALETSLAQAGQLRQQILAGQTTFARAAELHSAAPTAAAGGELGEIGRHEPMPEPFSRAAFELQEGQISEPVVSPFGVHLIQCQAIQPGEDEWQDVRGQLVPAIKQYLFRWTADRLRDEARVEYAE